MMFNSADFGHVLKNVEIEIRAGRTYVNGRAVEPIYRAVASGYEGTRKFKRDAQIPITKDGINVFQDNGYWIREYESLYVVDTNSVMRKGRRVSCTVALKVIKSNEKEDSTDYDVDLMIRMVFYQIRLNLVEPEKRGIYEFMHTMLLPSDIQIGLITDHDVMNHEKYNSAILPIYDDFYLPKNVKLIYASSDRGASSNIFSKLIRICDKKSTDLIQEHKAKIESVIGA